MTKVRFTLYWNCWQIFFFWRLKKMSASFQAICGPLGFSWTRENQQLNIKDTDVGSHKQCLGLLTLLALLCSGNYTINTSGFYYLDELYGNELVFVLSFVSSNNTDVETAEQFILLYTRYVCDFSGLTNFSQKLWKLEELISYFFFFALRFSCFWPTMNSLMLSTERSFASRMFAYSKG